MTAALKTETDQKIRRIIGGLRTCYVATFMKGDFKNPIGSNAQRGFETD